MPQTSTTVAPRRRRPHRREATFPPAITKEWRVPGYGIPVGRLQPVIEWWLNSDPAEDSKPPAKSFFLGPRKGEGHAGRLTTGRTLLVLAELSGVNPRRIYGIRSGEQRNVSLDVTDRLLVAMDCVFFFHLPPEQGGFSDIYFHPAVVGGGDDAR